jgi:transaldolase
MSETKNPLRRLKDFGQSVWLDYIRRDLLPSAAFRRMIDEDGLDGMTSNPTIFDKAIDSSADYNAELTQLVRAGKSVDDIYEALTTDDIKAAADKLRPIYDASEGRTGYVSYEVSPLLANDTAGTVAAAHRYFKMIDRPNLMIKVPSTPAGIPAIEQLIGEGRCINVTLMFSHKHYDDVANAYIRGLEKRAKAGQPLDRIASVASVFVSRVETLIDKRLESAPHETSASLRGTAAVANAKLIYQRFLELFHSDRFKALAAKGAHVQRPLWASTGTKDPKYSDTMPPATMDAYRDHGDPRLTVTEGVDQARAIQKSFAAIGIDFNEVGEELQKEGVESFAKSFEDLMAVIKKRSDAVKPA